MFFIMKRTVSVSYTCQNHENDSCLLIVSYSIEKQGKVSLISCEMSPEEARFHPRWLSRKKFQVEALLSNGTYSLLYAENNHVMNLDNSLFIDKAYEDIMKQEKMRFA